MAETAVTLLFDKLMQLMHDEAKIFLGVHDDIKSIQGDLSIINNFIKDAEEKWANEQIKGWLNELRKVAFQMEDVVDQYLLTVADRNQRDGVFGAVTKVKEKTKSAIHRHDIASEIEEIRKRIEDLKVMRETLELRLSSAETAATNTPATPRLDGHFVEQSEVVGIDGYKQELTDWLCRTETKRLVKVVVGAGGIGKTTLVKYVYNKQKEISQQKKEINKKRIIYFDFCAWITISWSQVDDGETLIRRIIQKLQEEDPNALTVLESAKTDMDSLVTKVREYFKNKRYLIVFDDVRDSTFWNIIKHVIPPDSNMRVIITSRGENVANYIRSDALVEVFKLEPLSPNDALRLFHQKAFQFEQEQYPELLELSKEFVKKCNRMPLAIVTIAGLLSTKMKTTLEWQKVLNQLGSLLQNNPHLENVQQVMLECYQDLPSHLKRCFLYFGLFPEGYSISCMRLVRLWIAEGFVKEIDSEDTSMEEFAKEYLIELIQRGLVHVSRVNFDKTPKSCYVHDLMHEFITRICEEQMFCQVMKDETTPANSKLDSAPRRLSIIKNKDHSSMKSAANWKTVRFCFVFDDANKWLVTEELFSSFKLLIRLDLSDVRLDNIPKQIGKLLNLKYLNLRNTNIKSLPESIGNLEKLQTLDLKRTQVHRLPEEIKKLIKLRHLLGYYIKKRHPSLNSLQGVTLNEGLQNLTSLQKLSFLDANDASMKELKQLRKLRKLGIKKLKGQHGEVLCAAIESMTHLCSLSIGAMEDNEMLQLQYLRNPPKSLQRLYLYGRLETLPNWIPKVSNLSRLYLKWSCLKEDPLPYLKDLSKLLHLELYNTYEGHEMHFMKGWLNGLEVLHIESMPSLKTIKIDEGALPNLGELKIGKCHKMMQVPSDVQNLRNLKKFHLYDMHEQFIKRMLDQQSEDYMIINKISLASLIHYSKDDHFATLRNLDS